MEPLALLATMVAVFVAVHVSILVYFYLRQSDAPDSWSDTESSVGGSGVVCRECGATNGPSYRFCKRCVADLSSLNASTSGEDGPDRIGSG